MLVAVLGICGSVLLVGWLIDSSTHRAFRRERRRAKLFAAEHGRTDMAGPLLDALYARDKEDRAAAATELIGVLAKLEPFDAGGLSRVQRANLRRAVTHPDRYLAEAALGALLRLRDTAPIPQIDELLRTEREPGLRQLATACRAEPLTALEAERTARTLLRSAQARVAGRAELPRIPEQGNETTALLRGARSPEQIRSRESATHTLSAGELSWLG